MGLQELNRSWWNDRPMHYDWHGTLPYAEGTPEFFREIDRRFLSSSPFYDGSRPFAALIPFDSLGGKRVLEIGCGSGFHTQLLAQAGALVSAIDLTPRATELTQKRLSSAGLAADVRVMDAEALRFADGEFDFAWSWGVIHHSARPERALREIHRVLKPAGELRLMVYHRRSLCALVNLLRGALSGKLARGMSLSDVLSAYSDGYVARYYTSAQLSRMLSGCGFSKIRTRVLGQKSELIPLPGQGTAGRFKSFLLSGLPDPAAKALLSSIGSFLFGTAVKLAPGAHG